MTEGTLHQRKKEGKAAQNNEKYEKQHPPPDFMTRESVLTVLIETSPHIRSLYHIFIVILLMLLCNTVVYDLVEKGKINIGLHAIVNGFGDVKRACILWLFEVSVAILFFPLVRLYGASCHLLRKSPGLCRVWSILNILGYLGLQTTLVLVPSMNIRRTYLGMASCLTVTLEMLRFVMKIHAVAAACAPRCHGNGVPLPTFSQYIYYLFAPTLLYRDSYPRTKTIRWSVVVFHFMEVAAIIFYNSFLWERFILPYWSEYGKQPRIEASVVVRGMFGCVLPGVIYFLCGFYCLLHAWLNAWAEMLRFGDRLFYQDWWTSSQFSRYYRAWNWVVYAWLRAHIYKPLAPWTSRAVSTFIVFFVSALAHEAVLALSFGYFYPVLMLEFAGLGLIMVPITASSGRRFPNALNLILWLCMFIGNGILWSLYPMEYFARMNCPPSEDDNFFKPKSWSCPEIVLRHNWTFQNPFSVFY